MTTKAGLMRASTFMNKERGPMTFGAFLSGVRTSMDLTQSELASRLKVSRAMICDIEKGRVAVSPTLASRIAREGGFPETLAIKYCVEDQLRRAKIRAHFEINTLKPVLQHS